MIFKLTAFSGEHTGTGGRFWAENIPGVHWLSLYDHKVRESQILKRIVPQPCNNTLSTVYVEAMRDTDCFVCMCSLDVQMRQMTSPPAEILLCF